MAEGIRELKQACAELEALRVELPDYQALLRRNESAFEQLRSSGADESALKEARGRIGVARELLEQHQSDIRTAECEVARLERSGEPNLERTSS